ncbi:MAG: cold shock domain-containing protein [Solirubrobacteraceae bacterium]
MSKRLEGVVVSFNGDRGVGFIKPDDGGEDFFVRWTEIVMDGFKTLAVGTRVRFEPYIEPETGNRQALEVHLVP